MKLICVEGDSKDYVWELRGKKFVIGRDPQCDIVVEDPALSRIHAEVQAASSRIQLKAPQGIEVDTAAGNDIT